MAQEIRMYAQTIDISSVHRVRPRRKVEIRQLSINWGDLNPCNGCEYSGLCDHDECGKKLYLLDVPVGTFKNLKEYIDQLKALGWEP